MPACSRILWILASASGSFGVTTAVGMFAFALVVTALCGFAVYIAKSLKMQNSLRTGASTQTESVEFTTFGAKYVFGAERLKIRESVSMPGTAIVNRGE